MVERFGRLTRVIGQSACVAEISLTGSAQFVPVLRGMADYRLVLDGLTAFVVDITSTSGR